MVELSHATIERLKLLFESTTYERAAEILREQCADNLPLWRAATPEGLERIRFAVLKLCKGEVQGLERAVHDAQVDWRDVLVAAGFAEDVHAHRKWSPSVG